MPEVTRHLLVYVGLAVGFGILVTILAGGRYGGEFFAGWLTEYSLSIDNLFIFLINMARVAVPRQLQQTALMLGIVIALVLRGGFNRRRRRSHRPVQLGLLPLRRVPGVDGGQAGSRVRRRRQGLRREPSGQVGAAAPARDPGLPRHQAAVRENGRRLATPMLLVVLALGTTDLLFALDSIPAIYGLTKEPYLVFTANVFALMGLRQLYFLIGGLLERLVYLSYGLAFLLGFIGVKLVLHALHENELPFVNGGEPVHWAPDVPIWLSLLIIVGTLALTTAASLARGRRTEEDTATHDVATSAVGGASTSPSDPTREPRTSVSG
jgi:tellurite resistance protein TerC